MHNAAADGQVDIVKLLIEAGADVEQADFSGQIPLYIADKYDHEECVDLMCGALIKS